MFCRLPARCVGLNRGRAPSPPNHRIVLVVDADGADAPTCGSVEFPCRSVKYAVEVRAWEEGEPDGVRVLLVGPATFREGGIGAGSRCFV